MKAFAKEQPKNAEDSPPFWLEYLIVAPVVAFSAPWALVKMWEWFMVPLGIAAVSYWHAIGLLSIVWAVRPFIVMQRPIEAAASLTIAFLTGWGAWINMP